MKLKYVSKIQTNLKNYKMIHTNKTTTRLIDGSYNSVYKGRSMNFDELREYVPGDDIKDIDWKATARSQKVLVRQYIAEKRHNILLLMDTNRRMLADTKSGREKRDIALMGAGTLAYLVSKNNDFIGSIFPTEKGMSYFPLRTGLINIENILAHYNSAVTKNNFSTLESSVEYIEKNIKRNMIILIVTDMEGINNIDENNLKMLKYRNDVLILCVSDASLSGKNVYNVDEEEYLPAYLTEDKKLTKRIEKKRKQIYDSCMDKVRKCGIAMVMIDDTKDLDSHIVELLEKHKLEMR